MDVALNIVPIEGFQDVIKALPQTTEIDTPGWPKRFVAIGLPIAAVALSSFNAYRITELNSEISALKSKTDLLVDVLHLHEAHLYHLEEDRCNEQVTGRPPRVKHLVHYQDHQRN
jgi:hypothetical protein